MLGPLIGRGPGLIDRLHLSTSRSTAATDGCKYLAGGEAGFRRGEQDIERRQFRRLTRTAHRRFLAEVGQFAFRLATGHLSTLVRVRQR
jgi:hypothetical protein